MKVLILNVPQRSRFAELVPLIRFLESPGGMQDHGPVADLSFREALEDTV